MTSDYCPHCSKPLDHTVFHTNHGIRSDDPDDFCDDGCAWERGICFDCEEDLHMCECEEVEE